MASSSLAAGVAAVLIGLASAQSLGTSGDNHPRLETYYCTHADGCVGQNTAVVLDSAFHWIHQKGNTLPCGPSNATVCSTEEECAENCVIEGISDYSTSGVTTNGSSLNMQMLSSTGTVYSPRLYLLAENETDYEMLYLTGNEISFDVDISLAPCGMNAALYMAEMPQSGNMGPLNPGGAAYGQGYCDAQCGVDTWVDGIANLNGVGSCCNEMDLWEANREATALTPHACNITGLYECTGELCSFDGVCDQWGCGYNPYGNGNEEFYGPGLTVDTTKPFTVVTQFNAFENGTLSDISRLYVQDGVIIKNPPVNESGMVPYTTINTDYCEAHAGGARFLPLGGVPTIGDALSRGMVLIFSIWWDQGGNMTWLDSGSAGPCTADEGNPSVIEKVQPNTQVTWSNIKWGEINSTFSAGPGKCTKRRM